MKFKFSAFKKGWNVDLLPRLFYNRWQTSSYETDKKDFGDGWIAYKEKEGTRKQHDTIRLELAWFGYTLLGVSIELIN